MTVKVTSICRICNAISLDEYVNENVSTFKTDVVEDFCPFCEQNSKVITKVEEVILKEKPKKNLTDKIIDKVIPEIPSNNFTELLAMALIILFWVYVMYSLGNPNW